MAPGAGSVALSRPGLLVHRLRKFAASASKRAATTGDASVQPTPSGGDFLTDIGAAHVMLEALPLGKAHLMTFELYPIGPLNPLHQLLRPPGTR